MQHCRRSKRPGQDNKPHGRPAKGEACGQVDWRRWRTGGSGGAGSGCGRQRLLQACCVSLGALAPRSTAQQKSTRLCLAQGRAGRGPRSEPACWQGRHTNCVEVAQALWRLGWTWWRHGRPCGAGPPPSGAPTRLPIALQHNGSVLFLHHVDAMPSGVQTNEYSGPGYMSSACGLMEKNTRHKLPAYCRLKRGPWRHPQSLRHTAACCLLLPLRLLLVCVRLDGAQEVQHPKAARRQAKLQAGERRVQRGRGG